jgi:hypothetical protein
MRQACWRTLPHVTTARHSRPMELSARLDLMNWLVSQGLTGLPETELIRGFCERCCDRGLHLSRGISLHDTLHPIYGRWARWIVSIPTSPRAASRVSTTRIWKRCAISCRCWGLRSSRRSRSTSRARSGGSISGRDVSAQVLGRAHLARRHRAHQCGAVVLRPARLDAYLREHRSGRDHPVPQRLCGSLDRCDP